MQRRAEVDLLEGPWARLSSLGVDTQFFFRCSCFSRASIAQTGHGSWESLAMRTVLCVRTS